MTREESIEKCEKVAKDLEDCMNGSDKDMLKALQERMNRTHPTLQQNFWRTIYNLAVDYSKKENYDGRNEHSVNLCEKIAELENVYLPYV